MVIHHVYVDDRRYIVTDEAALDSVRAALLDAARSGGGYVDLPGAMGVPTAVLVTGSTPVRIEQIGPPVDTPAEVPDDSYPDYFDIDWLDSTI